MTTLFVSAFMGGVILTGYQPAAQDRLAAAINLVRSGVTDKIDTQPFPLRNDAEVAPLANLVNLRWLSLRHSRITDKGLVHLQGLTNLQFLSLSDTSITDDGLKMIASQLPQLQELRIEQTRAGDAGMAYLKNLTALRTLALWKTAVTDGGLEHLAGLEDLADLNLDETHVSDVGILRLKPAKSLKVLRVWATRVTDGGARELIRALPDLEIRRGDKIFRFEQETVPAVSAPGSKSGLWLTLALACLGAGGACVVWYWAKRKSGAGTN